MTIPGALWESVRRRAGFTCEYCGVAEDDVGAKLSVDHFRPLAQHGTDDPENLLYCCHRCNLYKADYWPSDTGCPVLWNPRQEPRDVHLLLSPDGTLYPITTTGAFTLARLRLNRPPLVALRQRKRSEGEMARLLQRYRELVALLEQLSRQQAALLEEHRDLLQQQRRLLTLLLEGRQ